MYSIRYGASPTFAPDTVISSRAAISMAMATSCPSWLVMSYFVSSAAGNRTYTNAPLPRSQIARTSVK